MSLDYYLCSRRSYDKILGELRYIIDTYNEIEYVEKEEICADYLNNTFNANENKLFFIEKEKHTAILREMCHLKVLELCCHEFVDDVIDITPDNSQHITYCKICEFTKS